MTSSDLKHERLFSRGSVTGCGFIAGEQAYLCQFKKQLARNSQCKPATTFVRPILLKPARSGGRDNFPRTRTSQAVRWLVASVSHLLLLLLLLILLFSCRILIR